MGKSPTERLQNEIDNLTKTLSRISGGKAANHPGMKNQIKDMESRITSKRQELKSALKGEGSDELSEETFGYTKKRGN